MAEGCPIKTKLEEDCHPSCLKYWNEYDSCKTRINSYDSWEYDKLKHLAEHHGLPTKDSSRVSSNQLENTITITKRMIWTKEL